MLGALVGLVTGLIVGLTPQMYVQWQSHSQWLRSARLQAYVALLTASERVIPHAILQTKGPAGIQIDDLVAHVRDVQVATQEVLLLGPPGLDTAATKLKGAAVVLATYRKREGEPADTYDSAHRVLREAVDAFRNDALAVVTGRYGRTRLHAPRWKRPGVTPTESA